MVMDQITTGPIERAIVRVMRSNAGSFEPPLRGGIHNRLSPRKLVYPYVVYSKVSAPISYASAGNDGITRATIDALYDITVVALRSVDADNIDRLLGSLFGGPYADKVLQAFLEGQHVQRCQRVAETPTGPEREGTGQRVVEIGATYNIIVDVALHGTPPAP